VDGAAERRRRETIRRTSPLLSQTRALNRRWWTIDGSRRQEFLARFRRPTAFVVVEVWPCWSRGRLVFVLQGKLEVQVPAYLPTSSERCSGAAAVQRTNGRPVSGGAPCLQPLSAGTKGVRGSRSDSPLSPERLPATSAIYCDICSTYGPQLRGPVLSPSSSLPPV
jgi:hypothetical protein